MRSAPPELLAVLEGADLLAGVEEKLADDSKRTTSTTTKPVEAPTPMTSDMLAGRRLIQRGLARRHGRGRVAIGYRHGHRA